MRHAGFHGRTGCGVKPALVVVDVNVGFTDPGSPLVCPLDEVVTAIQGLLRETRAAGFPVIYTTVAYDDASRRAASVFIEKVPALLTLEPGSRWVEIDPRIAPAEGEAVLVKAFASAFFGTALDALQHGYRVLVPREAVGDRNPAAHEANLYDLDTKYADVVSVGETVAYLEEAAASRAAAAS